MMRRFFRVALDFSPAKVLVPILLMVPLFILGRSGQVQDVGAFLLMTTSMNFLNMVSTQWMQMASIRNYSKYRWSPAILMSSLVSTSLVTLVGMTIVWMATKHIGFAYPFGAAGWVWVACCALAMNAYMVLSGVSIGAGFIKGYSTTEVIRALVYTTGAMASLYFLRDVSFLYWSFFGSYAVSCLVLSALMWSKGLYSETGVVIGVYSFLRKQASYGLPFVFWFFGSQLLAVEDRYFINHFCDKADVGVYTINYQIASNAVMLVSGPVVGSCHINSVRLLREAPDRFWDFISKSTVVYVVVISVALLMIPVLGPLVIKSVFGREIKSGTQLLLTIGAGQALWGLAMILQKKPELEKKFDLMFLGLLAAVATNAAMNVYGVPKYGYIAAGWATFASYLVYTGVIAYFDHRLGWRFMQDFRRIDLYGVLAGFLKKDV